MGMRIKLQSTNHPNNLLKELNKCRLSETMCDVTIVVGSRSFPAHKAVLACAAGYFQNLFLNTGLDAARTYVVDFITPANFEKILSFVYTSELFTDLINVGVIYEVAERLGMEDLLRACHSTFPDLESTAVAKPLSGTGESHPGTQSCSSAEPAYPLGDLRGAGEHFGPDRNYVLPSDGGGSCKEEERNVTGDINQSLPLPQQPLPPKTEEHDAPAPFTPAPGVVTTQPVLGTVNMSIQTSTSSCQPYKVQSNGDFSKSSFFTPDNAIDITTGTNSCLSNSDHSKDPSFGQMDELQLDDLGDDDLQFEDPTEEIGTAEEVTERDRKSVV